jgi:hypothetical protein
MRNLTCTLSVLFIFYMSIGSASSLQGNSLHTTSKQPETIVKEYLNWYKLNRDRLEKINMVPGIPGDSTHAYTVDFTIVESYLREIKKSGFVSNSYIREFREYFKASDDYLKKNPQFDGPAYGFGIDLVFKAHDYFEIENNLQRMKVHSKSISGDKAKIIIQIASSKMIFNLTKSGRSWLIDSLTY